MHACAQVCMKPSSTSSSTCGGTCMQDQGSADAACMHAHAELLHSGGIVETLPCILHSPRCIVPSNQPCQLLVCGRWVAWWSQLCPVCWCDRALECMMSSLRHMLLAFVETTGATYSLHCSSFFGLTNYSIYIYIIRIL